MSATSVFETASSASKSQSQEKFFPAAPKTVKALGISYNTVVNLILKLNSKLNRARIPDN